MYDIRECIISSVREGRKTLHIWIFHKSNKFIVYLFTKIFWKSWRWKCLRMRQNVKFCIISKISIPGIGKLCINVFYERFDSIIWQFKSWHLCCRFMLFNKNNKFPTIIKKEDGIRWNRFKVLHSPWIHGPYPRFWLFYWIEFRVGI